VREGKLIRTIGQSLLRGSAEGPPESVENTHPANLSEKVAMHRVHDSLKAMKKLDDSWNWQDLQTFRKYHAKNCIVRWPNQPPTHGIDGHEQEAIAFFKMFPDQHLINNPYKIMLGQGEWTCTSHGPTDDEQQNYDDLAAAMQQADALRAGVAGNCPSVDQSAAFQLGCLEPTRLPSQSGRIRREHCVRSELCSVPANRRSPRLAALEELDQIALLTC
jgi:hypothetical protein